MIIRYPVFLHVRTRIIHLILSHDDLVGDIEAIDVEGGTYSGWDADARPLEFFVKDNWPAVRLKRENPDIESLKAAILAFAAKECPGTKYEHPKFADVSPLELLNDVKRHIEENISWLRRIWHFIR